MSDVGDDLVSGADLHKHLGRLAALYVGTVHRGPWFELLEVGPVEGQYRMVTVPADKPTRRHPTRQMGVLVDWEYPVRDAPRDAGERLRMRIGLGDRLLAPKPMRIRAAPRHAHDWRRAEVSRWPDMKGKGRHGIAETIRSMIHAGVLKQGKLLPSAVSIEAQCGVSRFLVRQALRDLAERGIVRYVQGRGYFVHGEKDE